MKYIVRFHDNPGMEDQRQAHMSAHLSFLQAQGPVIYGAGPLFENDQGSGGLWLVEADSAEAVDALVRADPLFATGLRKSWDILEWRQVFRDGRRLI
ncbi:MAG: YciI family protein [Paracoccaceae bacterium]